MKKLLIFMISIQIGLILNAQVLENLTIGLESNTVWYNDDSETGPFFDTSNNDGNKHLSLIHI